jgi:hypothetical protein
VYAVAMTSDVSPARPRRPARDLIELVLEHMRHNLEPLKYSTLAPSRYLVYLHAEEYARLEGILGVVQQQTIRALNEELAALNEGTGLTRYARRVWKRPMAAVENAAPEWHVEFLVDPDGDLQPGDVLVDSELLLPPGPELGVGARTRRIATVYTGSRAARDVPAPFTSPTAPVPSTAAAPPLPAPPMLPTRPTASEALARISYEDDAGAHEYAVVKGSVSIGRGGVAYPVDVRITAVPDVSREHARIRHDSNRGCFYLIDLSSLGTTIDGVAVPRGYDDSDGSKRENGVEVALPERARIGLANVVFLDFRVER